MSGPSSLESSTDAALFFADEQTTGLLAAIVTSSQDAILSKTLDGIVTSWNGAAERLFGYSAQEMIGRSIRTLIPADRQHEEDDILARISSGKRIENYETMRLAKDGRLLDLSVTISPLRDRGGRIVGASKVARDISDRRRYERHVETLLMEINHRSKNLLGVVQAIAFQTQANDIADYRARFADRLQALSTNQSLIIEGDWRCVDMAALARNTFDTLLEGERPRVSFDGPALTVRPAAAQSIGLALHELLANARRHGALKESKGHVVLAWQLESERFTLTWREKDGPIPHPREKVGFGTRLITRQIEASLDGTARLEFQPHGLFWQIIAPAETVIYDPLNDR
ncbi:PAS domain S-box-containing protein [Fulvimarina manganoxydans]|uniref:Blue-light-activated histidine kinase n=1 Tax=Fulvimarina manganoxydans TaxID=937218 RepID=A0A1W1YGH5_9HYPH|nr:PAS domain S-box protein [Fulvimarina manganoxydans]SMC34858.1 PAS domain S-box-containing protein [Fulvimarina manganoxydans]